MNDKTCKVLFTCKGNSARAILAEALLNQMGEGRFGAFSAGSQPKGAVHPLELRKLQSRRIPPPGSAARAWEDFAAPDALEMDVVFAVCDQAAGEVARGHGPGLPACCDHDEAPASA